MNIYDYFNSRDVAEHCQNIGHKFNALAKTGDAKYDMYDEYDVTLVEKV